VTELYPARIPDLFAAKPLVISGRYGAAASGVIRLRGRMAGREFTREIRVSLPASQPENDVLATLWARRRVADLMSQDFHGFQYGTTREDIQRQITQLGLEYRLMTPFTSFVAVEEKVVTEGGAPRRVEVPVEMPEGMSYEGVFGSENRLEVANARMMMMTPAGLAGGVMEARAAPTKLHPAIAAAIQRVKSGGRPSTDESRFVFGGDAFVRVTVSDASAGALEQLRKAGFVISRREGNVLSGHIPVAGLEAVSNLAFVMWIAPR